MTAKFFVDSVFDDALKLFGTGLGLKEVAAELKCHPDALSKFVRSRGFVIPKIERPSARRKNLPDAEIVALYVGGLSELELSKQFGVSRQSVRTRLTEAGCDIRGQSDANIVSMGRMTAKERQERAKAAHDAIRGTKCSHDRLVRRALTLQRQPSDAHMGPGEDEFDEALTQLGIEFERQKPVDVYNLDFAIGRVAVELKFGATGNGKTHADRKRGRIKKLADCDYRVCYITFNSVLALLMSTDYVVTHLDHLSRQPASGGQYWVISCGINEATRFRNERGQWASMRTPKQLVHTFRAFNV